MSENQQTQSIIRYAEDGQIIIDNGQTQDVMYGDNVSNVIISSGGTQTFAGGSAVHVIIDGGYQSVTGAGAYTSDVTINNGGSQYVEGARAQSVVINSGGVQSVGPYGFADGITINNGGQQTVGGIGTKTAGTSNVIISSGGEQYITGAGSASNITIDGGIQYIANGGSVYNTIINDGGIQYVSGGGFVSNTTINSGARLEYVAGGMGSATIKDVTINDGGTLLVGGASLEGAITLNEGATINLDNKISGGATIKLVGNGNHDIVVKSDGLNQAYDMSIEGFQGDSGLGSDRILFQGLNADQVASIDYVDANGNSSDDYVTIRYVGFGFMTLHILGIKQTGFEISAASDGSVIGFAINSSDLSCFLAGTMVRIPGGRIAVENLAIGDRVYTFDWKHNKKGIRRICWVGNNNIIVQSNLPDDQAGYPVRIYKDAIAQGIPYKDLLVTPEHCLFFDGKFVPVRMLVNGTSICYDHSITEYTYYHIETEEHSVVWANGMLTESYLDTGNRNNFRQHGQLAMLNANPKSKNWDKDSAAPLVVDRSYVEPLYNQILQRALDMGFAELEAPLLTQDADFHILTEQGDIIYPQFDGVNKYSFVLLENISKVYLKSRVSRPCDIIGSFVDDRRQLGLLIGDIVLLSFDKENNFQQHQMTNYLTEQNLSGWDVLEQSRCRWTNGHAELDVSFDHDKKRALIIQVVASNSYITEEQKDLSVAKKVA